MSEHNQEQNEPGNEEDHSMSLAIDTIVIGFFGGLIWSFIGHIAYYFNMMDFSPKFILTSWITLAWVHGWLGIVMSLLLFGVLSILSALIYYLLLKKAKSIFAGILYGAGLWLLLVFILKPMFPDFPTFAEMTANTIITSFCIFILYGVFVGYSISYEYQEIDKQKQAKAKQEADMNY
ncbi:YqhR family membrane protein [Peribacillus cavernae]|nr:YqhR family membrane protein [Peribacillus cavernae]MDQ0218365.1 preprotein translocase subunit SecG [Peribacillus cavernae]